jgi:hypothetical protein
MNPQKIFEVIRFDEDTPNEKTHCLYVFEENGIWQFSHIVGGEIIFAAKSDNYDLVYAEYNQRKIDLFK